uniref:polynucleotide adenylyltransferase n=1 Tax=Macrostomum lignano TaxID=282301 RepID=A0A1I8HQ59_9PLAT
MTCIASNNNNNANGKVKEKVTDNGNNNRYSVLCYEQVLRLHEFMEKEVTIHGRGHCCPSVKLTLRDMIQRVCQQLEASNIGLRDLRLNGGGATFIIGMDSVHTYNDLDLLFGVDLSSSGTVDEIKRVVLDCLRSFLPEGSSASSAAVALEAPQHQQQQQQQQQQSVRRRQYSSGGRHGPADPIEGYVRKLVRIQNTDSWYLISLGDSAAHQTDGVTVELKFVDRMRRKFEFTVDSFQIILDSLLTFYRLQPRPTAITEHFYPTVIAESVSGSFAEAYAHLVRKEICTRNPEEIRGGGLLKYCKLLVEGFLPAQGLDVVHLEKYMCSRFFIDFPDLRKQRAKIESYLTSHFPSDKDLELSAQYL